MAVSDVKDYAHLSAADVEAIGAELEAIRVEVLDSLDEADRRYVRTTIALQRGLVAGGRAALLFRCSARPTSPAVG